MSPDDFDRKEVARRGRILHRALSGNWKIMRRKLLAHSPDQIGDSLRTIYHVSRKVLKGG